MAEINGTKGILLIDDVAFVAQINNSMAIEKDILDITRKGETRGKIYTGDGEYDTGLDMEILYDSAAAMGVIQAKDKLVNGTRAILKFGQTGAGEVYFQVSGFAKSLTMNFPKNEIAIVPVAFQGNGEVSILNVGGGGAGFPYTFPLTLS